MTTDIVIASKLIPLSKQGPNKGKHFAIVSYWWYEFLMQFNWHAALDGSRVRKTKYYVRRCIQVDGIERVFWMHWIVAGHRHVDHINRNGLDNTENNFRPSDKSQNMANRTAWGTSKHKGVHWYKQTNKWKARIYKNKKCYYLGYFKCESCAAWAYDVKATELHGEFANLNFPLIK